jgi:hypothetical protein
MQPPEFDDIDSQPPFHERGPKTAIPKTIGILNIVFGSLLLLCAVCSALNLAIQPALGPMFAAQQQQFQQVQQADRQQKLDQLEKEEQAAKNKEEKAAVQARHKALKDQPLVKMPDMTKFTQDPTFQAYGIADAVTGLILNILLVVSGIGLLSLKEWARRLGLWVAALKIVFLFVLYGIFIVVVVPRVTEAFTSVFREMMDEMAKTAPPGQPVPGKADLEQMGTILGLVYTGGAIVMIIFGVIYPVVMLVLLSRPRVKAACAAAAISNDKGQG